ncbi:MAG: ChrR family anti-sigma-E factor [Paracoccaceae bacterium]|nr:ChrR family anti-sigma-E factor [Paracoccaceae bacterium]
METINHHLNDTLLMGYAAGTLPEAFNLIVATHISMCDECRARLGSFEAVGGSLIEDADAAVPMASSALGDVMARISGASRADDIRLPVAREARTFPAPLVDYVGGDLADVKWRSLGGGVRHAVLNTGGKATARLLHIPAGTKLPEHGHKGLEATLVLQGAFSDADGRFARGDIEIAGEDLDHTPVADEGEDCICLAVTDAPLKFSGWIPRIAQPFLGI